jgi:hypothetical protein
MNGINGRLQRLQTTLIEIYSDIWFGQGRRGPQYGLNSTKELRFELAILRYYVSCVGGLLRTLSFDKVGVAHLL